MHGSTRSHNATQLGTALAAIAVQITALNKTTLDASARTQRVCYVLLSGESSPPRSWSIRGLVCVGPPAGGPFHQQGVPCGISRGLIRFGSANWSTNRSPRSNASGRATLCVDVAQRHAGRHVGARDCSPALQRTHGMAALKCTPSDPGAPGFKARSSYCRPYVRASYGLCAGVVGGRLSARAP